MMGGSLPRLPRELEEAIFAWLDYPALLAGERVCVYWRDLIRHSPAIYPRLWRALIRRRPALASVLVCHPPPQDPPFHRYYRSWHHLVVEGFDPAQAPRVTAIQCPLQDETGQPIEISEAWMRAVNFTGVYDMVWDVSASLLTCSIYQFLQVWDMRSPRLLKTHHARALDQPGKKSVCFTTQGPFLMCGKENGEVELKYLLRDGELDVQRPSHHFICDMKAHGGVLMLVDWFGGVTRGRIRTEAGPPRWAAFDFQAGSSLAGDYSTRGTERLLDFNQHFLVATHKRGYLYHNRHRGTFAYHANPSRVAENTALCVALYGEDESYMGFEKGLVLCQRWSTRDGLITWSHQAQSPDAENVTALAVNERYLVIGDSRGEFHVFDKSRLGRDERTHLRTYGTGHSYGCFIWGIHLDGSRIISGDSDGKLVVHDFFHPPPTGEPDERPDLPWASPKCDSSAASLASPKLHEKYPL